MRLTCLVPGSSGVMGAHIPGFMQSAQPQTAGQLAESLIQQDAIPDNGKFPAFNMAARLNNLNAGEPTNMFPT